MIYSLSIRIDLFLANIFNVTEKVMFRDKIYSRNPGQKQKSSGNQEASTNSPVCLSFLTRLASKHFPFMAI